MDYRIEWSPEATEDIVAIAEYIARDSVFYARAVIAKILATSRSLGEFPKLGRIVPELGADNFRERFAYSYRLIYRIEPDRTLIVAVVHGKRLLELLSARFPESI